MRNFQELAFCGRKGLLCGTLCDFSRKDFTKNTYSGSCPKAPSNAKGVTSFSTSCKPSLRKHPFLLALRCWGHFAQSIPPRETSPAAKSEEKRMFSQAIVRLADFHFHTS